MDLRRFLSFGFEKGHDDAAAFNGAGEFKGCGVFDEFVQHSRLHDFEFPENFLKNRKSRLFPNGNIGSLVDERHGGTYSSPLWRHVSVKGTVTAEVLGLVSFPEL